MSYNILGVNPGHNGSVALVSDGELVYFVEEERLSRLKYDGNPFRGIMDIINKGYHIDEVVVGGTHTPPELPWNREDPYFALVRKHFPNVKSTLLAGEHHITHAATAFYNSGFDKALAIVVDGAGSLKQEYDEMGQPFFEGFETESVFVCEYPAKFSVVHKVYGNNFGNKFYNGLFDFDDATNIVKSYEAVSQYLGFGFIEAGKTMGLAPYGKKDNNLPNLFVGNRGSKDVFVPSYPAGAFIDQARIEYLRQERDPREWHTDPDKLTDVEKNLAWAIQEETQKLVLSLIEKAIETTGIKNVVISGGYGLNCVANYYYTKKLPDVNFYFEPISNDGGTTIGAAKLIWHGNNEDETIRPQTTLYNGPSYTSDDIESALEEHSENIDIKKVTYKDVAELIADRNIVAMYQGRSEAGPRALGNRSILYDPRDPDGKDHVNVVKGREWFRPFAGSVLEEDAKDWFDMSQDTSPFMMMAVNVAADKIEQIPAICHVDDTCRVQTVSEEQNKHYYNLIKAFKDITGVPVLFNTSFNLAGDPLVETIEDALNTLYRSELKYLYLPEFGVLVEKSNA